MNKLILFIAASIFAMVLALPLAHGQTGPDCTKITAANKDECIKALGNEIDKLLEKKRNEMQENFQKDMNKTLSASSRKSGAQGTSNYRTTTTGGSYQSPSPPSPTQPAGRGYQLPTTPAPVPQSGGPQGGPRYQGSPYY